MLNVIDSDFDKAYGASKAGVPAGLDRMAPGPVLAAWLSAIDVKQLSGYDRVVVLRAHQRLATHYQAHAYRDMAAITDAVRTEVYDTPIETELAAEAEIRVALTWTRRLAESELGFALDLQQRLPRLFDLLESGAIDVRRAKVIVDGTIHLPVDTAQSVLEHVIDDAPALTTGQLRSCVKKLCIAADPNEAVSRYKAKVEERRIELRPSVDGTAHLMAFDLPPDDASVAMGRISALARAAKTADDPRTADQIRADVYLDLLCGRDVAAVGASGGGTVNIRVDLDTLAELNDSPAELAGYGPVIADIARKVADGQQKGQWRYTVTDPDTGQAVVSGITRRRPTAHQRRTVEALYPTCVFPGCRAPARDSDLDHRRNWAEGGPTAVDNLTPLCKHDHRIKHEAGWRYRITQSGRAEWITRLGHTYQTARPPP